MTPFSSKIDTTCSSAVYAVWPSRVCLVNYMAPFASGATWGWIARFCGASFVHGFSNGPEHGGQVQHLQRGPHRLPPLKPVEDIGQRRLVVPGDLALAEVRRSGSRRRQRMQHRQTRGRVEGRGATRVWLMTVRGHRRCDGQRGGSDTQDAVEGDAVAQVGSAAVGRVIDDSDATACGQLLDGLVQASPGEQAVGRRRGQNQSGGAVGFHSLLSRAVRRCPPRAEDRMLPPPNKQLCSDVRYETTAANQFTRYALDEQGVGLFVRADEEPHELCLLLDIHALMLTSPELRPFLSGIDLRDSRLDSSWIHRGLAMMKP